MRLLIILIISLALFSCESKYPGFLISQKGVYFKYLQLGEDNERPGYGDYIVVDLAYLTVDDSLFFKGRRKFQITKNNFDGSIDECFSLLSIGDSADFIISADKFFNKTLGIDNPSFLPKNSDMKITAKMLDFLDQETYDKQKAEFLSWVEDFGEYEKVLLGHYLDNEDISVSPSRTGLYHVVLKEGNDNIVAKGDTVVVHYEGRFLSGKTFDSTVDRNSPFEFVYGTEWQVIKGLEEAIGKMKEQEKALFIMPSDIAFGNNGSSTGIIPPFTSVIFTVELIQIRKTDSLITN